MDQCGPNRRETTRFFGIFGPITYQGVTKHGVLWTFGWSYGLRGPNETREFDGLSSKSMDFGRGTVLLLRPYDYYEYYVYYDCYH